MKIFVVDLIYGREWRVHAQECRPNGEIFEFIGPYGNTIDTVRREIVRGITEIDDPSTGGGFTSMLHSEPPVAPSVVDSTMSRRTHRTSEALEYELAVEKELREWIRREFGQHAADRAVVRGRDHITGMDGNPEELDVSAKVPVGGIVIFIVCECKNYKRPVEKGIVQKFVYVTQNVGANLGFLFTPEGFQEGAKTVAEKAGVKLVVQEKRIGEQPWKIIIPAGVGAVLLQEAARAAETSNLKEDTISPKQQSRAPSLSPFASAPDRLRRKYRGLFEDAEYRYPLAPELESQIARLQSGTAEERLAAIGSLGETLRKLWVQCFSDVSSKAGSRPWEWDDLDLRQESALPHPAQITELDSVWDALSSLLGHADISTREQAINAFRFLDDGIISHGFLRRLRYSRWGRRESDYWGQLRKLTETISVSLARLVERLADPDAGLRRSAAAILMRGLPFLPYWMDFDLGGDFFFNAAYQSELALRFPILEQSVREADEVVRDAALTVLCTLRDNRIVSPLAPHLESGLSKWKIPIAHAFGRLNFDQKEAGQRGLNDLAGITLGKNLDLGRTRDVPSRRACVAALENGKFPSAVPWLVEALEDTEEGIKKSAAIGLANCGDERGVPILLDGVKRSKSYEYGSVEALCKLRERKAIPVFEAKCNTAGEKGDRELYLAAIRKIDTAEADRIKGAAMVGNVVGAGLAILGAIALIAEKDAAESASRSKPQTARRSFASRLGRKVGRHWIWFRTLFRKNEPDGKP